MLKDDSLTVAREIFEEAGWQWKGKSYAASTYVTRIYLEKSGYELILPLHLSPNARRRPVPEWEHGTNRHEVARGETIRRLEGREKSTWGSQRFTNVYSKFESTYHANGPYHILTYKGKRYSVDPEDCKELPLEVYMTFTTFSHYKAEVKELMIITNKKYKEVRNGDVTS